VARVKPNGLGRGLGQLMEQRPPTNVADAPVPVVPQPALNTSAGLKILLSGNPQQTASGKSNGHPTSQAQMQTASAVSGVVKEERSFVPESLIAADLLLCALACRLILAGNPAPLDWMLAGLSLLLGGWAGCLGVAQLLKRATSNTTPFSSPLGQELPFTGFTNGAKN